MMKALFLALPGIFQNNSPRYGWYDQSWQESQRAGERREDNIQKQFRDFNLTSHPARWALEEDRERVIVFSPSAYRRQYTLQTSNILESKKHPVVPC